MKLLIVDDHLAVRKMLKSMYGFMFDEIFEAEDGIEAVMLYKQNKPNWVFMDVKMEQMDGITATRKIKQFDKNAKVVVVTLYCDEELESDAVKAGAYDVISKDDLTKIGDILNEIV